MIILIMMIIITLTMIHIIIMLLIITTIIIILLIIIIMQTRSRRFPPSDPALPRCSIPLAPPSRDVTSDVFCTRAQTRLVHRRFMIPFLAFWPRVVPTFCEARQGRPWVTATRRQVETTVCLSYQLLDFPAVEPLLCRVRSVQSQSSLGRSE